MAVLKSLGIKNLRSLKNIDPVPISPITVLIGKNSIGKSTFARVFPLIRQSVERKKKSPILWFGDYVDFGSISKALTKGESDLCFDFSLSLSDEDIHHVSVNRSDLWFRDSYDYYEKIKLKDFSVKITVSRNEDLESSFSKRIEFFSKDFNFKIDFDGKKNHFEEGISISVNDQKFSLPNGFNIHQGQGDILPNIFFSKEEERDFNGVSKKLNIISRNPWVDGLHTAIKLQLHGNVSTATARKLASQIPLGSVDEIAEAIGDIDGPTSWNELKFFGKNFRQIFSKKIQTQLVAGLIPEIVEQANTALKKYFASVRYLKPLRATAERYYRKQELAIHEIDAEGRNLAVFLDSLPRYSLNSFRDWIEKNLKINVKTLREGEQIMIMAKGLNDQEFYNITDMGFGISQVLPIAAQLWAMNFGLKDIGRSSAIVIEQPELHLHPEFQARLADVFAASVKVQNNHLEPASLIIETHSQHIVNRLGALVEKGILQKEDVTILLFEPSGDSEKSTKIRVSKFDDDGILTNWPFGFFEPGDIDVD